MRAYYTADRAEFYGDSDDDILGKLTRYHSFDVNPGQRGAWIEEIGVLRNALSGLQDFTLFLEFSVPRVGKRVDVIVVIGDAIFVIEFKQEQKFQPKDLCQAEDYALDLKNFHAGSHSRSLYPILVSTRAPRSQDVQLELAFDQVATPIGLCAADLGPVLMTLCQRHAVAFDATLWAQSGYKPTPTIVEAARALYARHDVKDIARSDADAANLTRTQDVISQVVQQSQAHKQKSICFITGVPGAGKTLAGLNIATQRSEANSDGHATFLSGNGPLVAVLTEALVRDRFDPKKNKRKDVERKVHKFIQNIHHFRDEYALRDPGPPDDHIVVFDEAQRAWTREKTSSFMRQKKGVASFDMSEPHFLLSVMDRHPDWCTVVCLIGGGQEINTGEAGMSEWMAAIRDHFPHWQVHASAQIVQPDYDLNDDAKAFIARPQVTLHEDLHLSVSMRSFRAETLANFVTHLLNNDAKAAREALIDLAHYPIWMTRDLSAARQWLREAARGTERYGLVASSGAHRLKPEGLHLKASIDPPNWFLNDRDDVRSSFYLEDAASEFDVQGLELDWTGVCWDADLRHDGREWQGFNFKGARWETVKDHMRRLYLKNAYRVILTRARQGMVIFIPRGDDADPTRPQSYYDATWDYLRACRIAETPPPRPSQSLDLTAELF